MADREHKNLECAVCGSLGPLTYVLLSQSSLDEDEAYVPEDPYILCEDHWEHFVEGDEYHVREIAPVPPNCGGFTRSTDEKTEILFDREESTQCWIRFDPKSDEIDLPDGKEATEDSNND